jgi:hypothetical protein
MINFEVFLKISYGLYIVSSGDKNRGNGFISNTVNFPICPITGYVRYAVLKKLTSLKSNN